MNEKYDKIIQVSLKLFVEKGFHNTPTSLIAKEANIATGTLFHYFENKETLINTVYIDSKDSLINALKANIDATLNIPDLIKKMFLSSIKWCLENPERFAFFQTFSNSPFISDNTKEKVMEMFDFLEDVIEKGQKNGYFKEISVELLFNAMFGIMIQMMNYFYEKPDRFNNNKNVESAFTLLWDALKK